MIPVELPAADRAAAYGLDRVVVDGNDVAAVQRVVGDAVTAARSGQGPSLVEAQTYRLKGHSVADGAAYRPAEEVARWRERDPLLRTRAALAAAGTDTAKLDEIDARTKADLADLAQQVLARPAPEPSERVDRRVERRELAMAELTYRQAVAAALAQEMARDDRVVLLGEDVASGGVFKTTGGLRERFGPDRVWNTPISEQAIAGAAMGAAMAGLRPVAEIMFADFYATCWDQVANEIAKVRYMTGGQVSMPLVLRGANGSGEPRVRQPARPVGGELGHGRARAQDRLAGGPGRGVRAARRRDPGRRPGAGVRAQGAVRAQGGGRPRASTCCRWARPAPCGRAATSRWSGCRSRSAPAWPPPTSWPKTAIAAEVLDLRTLVPLDAAAVLASVRRTGRLVVAEENPGQLGWGAAIAAIVAEEAFGDLSAPVTRVSGGNVPLPVAASLEAEVDVVARRAWSRPPARCSAMASQAAAPGREPAGRPARPSPGGEFVRAGHGRCRGPDPQ